MTSWEYIIEKLPEVLKYTHGQTAEDFERFVYSGTLRAEVLTIEEDRVGFIAYKLLEGGKEFYVAAFYLEKGVPKRTLPAVIGIMRRRMRQFGAKRLTIRSPRLGWLRRLAEYKPTIEYMMFRFDDERQGT